MKRFTLLALSLCFAVASFAQTQRTVLLEHFTQASCGPCATYNPAVENYLSTAPNAISLKYQVSWPGTDPMNAHNPGEVSARQNYYGVNSVPNSVVDGNVYNGHPSTPFPTSGGSATMDNRALVMSPFEINATHSLSSDYSSVNINATVTATQSVSNPNLKVHVAVVENHISFATPPGSNGETDFFSVMKKMLPTPTGTDLSSSWAVNDVHTISESWVMSNMYNITQVGVVIFVQDNVTKEVLQAAYSEVVTMPHANDVAATGGDAEVVCGAGTFDPVVSIQNFGNTILNSIEISYDINGGQSLSHVWNGSLDPLASTDVTLPAMNLNQLVAGANTINYSVTNPNNTGTNDDYTGNDSNSKTVETAPELTENITIKVKTDNYGYETFWRLTSSTGTVLASGGNPVAGSGNASASDANAYGNNTEYVVQVTIPANDCYDFYIVDDYNDGMCCSYGNGYYRIYDDQNNLKINGGAFGSNETKVMQVPLASSTDKHPDLATSLKTFPNPATDQFNISFNLETSSKLSISLVNALGQEVRSIATQQFSAGQHLLDVNTSSIAAGMYFVVIRGEDSMTTERVVINK